MRRVRLIGIVLCLALIGQPVRAGVDYSGEEIAPLPAQWRGFLLDLRALRMIGIEPKAGEEFNPLRAQYRDACAKLEAIPKRTPRETADLGAVWIRLGQPRKAIELLRKSRGDSPESYAILSNLAVAWFLAGDPDEAIRTQREAIRLAPAASKRFEEFQRKWMEARKNEAKSLTAIDDLFGTEFPKDDVAILQRLALSFLGDARLIWQLAERTNAHGDIRSAASLMDVVVVELAFTPPAARERRQTFRTAADKIAMLPDIEHAKYRGDLAMLSPRPLVRRTATAALPAIRDDGPNLLPWTVVSETIIEKPFRPKFHGHLNKLDGKTVSLSGYMQPLSTDIDVVGFMLIEFPVGCWFCETPEPAGIVYVELPAGKSVTVKRSRIKVTGTLKLNPDEPEDFLYTLRNARIADPD
jgi:hypothetical protein